MRRFDHLARPELRATTRRLALACLAAAALAGCETVKPYEKEYLLNPLMDDQSVTEMQPTFMSSASAAFEKLATGSQLTGGSACPTCGG